MHGGLDFLQDSGAPLMGPAENICLLKGGNDQSRATRKRGLMDLVPCGARQGGAPGRQKERGQCCLQTDTGRSVGIRGACRISE